MNKVAADYATGVATTERLQDAPRVGAAADRPTGKIPEDSPLGRSTTYASRYAPGLLCPLSRADKRRLLGIRGVLPFDGEDIWTAWDLTWLSPTGKPEVATASVRVPASSPNLVESKSLKLYLNSFAMTPFEDMLSVAATIGDDLSRVCGAEVEVSLTRPDGGPLSLASLPGSCIDNQSVNCSRWEVDASLLASIDAAPTSETLHSHLLRCLCPVTGQPDIGSILIRYRGPRIDPAALLRYLISYREHSDFHEHCVERIFVDVRDRCRTETLSVYARYNRRGGIDINPFRSDSERKVPDLRLWRQ